MHAPSSKLIAELCSPLRGLAVLSHSVFFSLVHPLQDCFDLDAARYSYFDSLFPLNPGGIIPSGPTAADLGFDRSPGVDSGRGPRDTLEDVFHMRPASSAITGAVA